MPLANHSEGEPDLRMPGYFSARACLLAKRMVTDLRIGEIWAFGWKIARLERKFLRKSFRCCLKFERRDSATYNYWPSFQGCVIQISKVPLRMLLRVANGWKLSDFGENVRGLSARICDLGALVVSMANQKSPTKLFVKFSHKHPILVTLCALATKSFYHLLFYFKSWLLYVSFLQVKPC